jgi:GMP reductase
MRIITEEQLDFDDVLIQPKCSKICSRKQINLFREFKWCNDDNSKNFSMTCIPYGTTNMGTVGTCNMAKLMVKSGHIACLEKHISYEEIEKFFSSLSYEESTRVIPSIGIKESIDDIVKLYKKFYIKMIMIDVPNGYISSLVTRINELHTLCPDACIIAGNVVDSAGASQLIDAGATIIKVGIGSGSACLTRKKTGVGRPQLSTIIEVADICHQHNCYVMSDGGANSAGDICKAFGAGADFVISGSLFAGCEEADNRYQIVKDGKIFKRYYGMSSHLAQELHFGGIRNYSASEGREKLIPYIGTLSDVLQDIDGGLKSCCTYIGCTKMKNFSKHTTFYKVNRQLNMKFNDCLNI